MASLGVSTKKTPDGVKEILTGLPLSVHRMSPPLHVHPVNENGLPCVPFNIYGVTVIAYVPPETVSAAVPNAISAFAQPLPNGLVDPAMGHHDLVGMVTQIRVAPAAGQLPCAAAKTGGWIENWAFDPKKSIAGATNNAVFGTSNEYADAGTVTPGSVVFVTFSFDIPDEFPVNRFSLPE
jgi:hypothetical protein